MFKSQTFLRSCCFNPKILDSMTISLYAYNADLLSPGLLKKNFLKIKINDDNNIVLDEIFSHSKIKKSCSTTYAQILFQLSYQESISHKLDQRGIDDLLFDSCSCTGYQKITVQRLNNSCVNQFPDPDHDMHNSGVYAGKIPTTIDLISHGYAIYGGIEFCCLGCVPRVTSDIPTYDMKKNFRKIEVDPVGSCFVNSGVVNVCDESGAFGLDCEYSNVDSGGTCVVQPHVASVIAARTGLSGEIGIACRQSESEINGSRDLIYQTILDFSQVTPNSPWHYEAAPTMNPQLYSIPTKQGIAMDYSHGYTAKGKSGIGAGSIEIANSLMGPDEKHSIREFHIPENVTRFGRHVTSFGHYYGKETHRTALRYKRNGKKFSHSYGKFGSITTPGSVRGKYSSKDNVIIHDDKLNTDIDFKNNMDLLKYFTSFMYILDFADNSDVFGLNYNQKYLSKIILSAQRRIRNYERKRALVLAFHQRGIDAGKFMKSRGHKSALERISDRFDSYRKYSPFRNMTIDENGLEKEPQTKSSYQKKYGGNTSGACGVAGGNIGGACCVAGVNIDDNENHIDPLLEKEIHDEIEKANILRSIRSASRASERKYQNTRAFGKANIFINIIDAFKILSEAYGFNIIHQIIPYKRNVTSGYYNELAGKRSTILGQIAELDNQYNNLIDEIDLFFNKTKTRRGKANDETRRFKKGQKNTEVLAVDPVLLSGKKKTFEAVTLERAEKLPKLQRKEVIRLFEKSQIIKKEIHDHIETVKKINKAKPKIWRSLKFDMKSYIMNKSRSHGRAQSFYGLDVSDLNYKSKSRAAWHRRYAIESITAFFQLQVYFEYLKNGVLLRKNNCAALNLAGTSGECAAGSGYADNNQPSYFYAAQSLLGEDNYHNPEVVVSDGGISTNTRGVIKDKKGKPFEIPDGLIEKIDSSQFSFQDSLKIVEFYEGEGGAGAGGYFQSKFNLFEKITDIFENKIIHTTFNSNAFSNMLVHDTNFKKIKSGIFISLSDLVTLIFFLCPWIHLNSSALNKKVNDGRYDRLTSLYNDLGKSASSINNQQLSKLVDEYKKTGLVTLAPTRANIPAETRFAHYRLNAFNEVITAAIGFLRNDEYENNM